MHHWNHLYCFPVTESYERFPYPVSCCIVMWLDVAYVNHFKVLLLVWVVAIGSIGGYLLGNIREYPRIGCVSTGEDVKTISVWA